jgi:GT2 family glycosyltransferase
VIVPAYDDVEPLVHCLRALTEQDYPAERYEVVVVDNGSRQDLRALVAGFPGFRYEHEPRVGSYAARNRGIEASKGAILAFTDADCRPEPGWLGAGVAALSAVPELGAVGGPIEMFAPAGRTTAFVLHDLVWGMPQRIYIERFGITATGNLFVRRESFERAGAFDPRFLSCGDAEWCFRLAARGLRLGYAPAARVRHPARAQLAAFLRRRRRIAGGYHLLTPLVEREYPESGFRVPSSFATSIRRIRNNLGHPLLGTRWRKTQFACAELLLYAVTRLESWRLRLGGKPIRG